MPQPPPQLDIADRAVSANDDLQDDLSLDTSATRGFCVLSFDFMEKLRRFDA
jgi:hypothetical protein